jgi:glycosyltransferase involved in cell wall biosynthesis
MQYDLLVEDFMPPMSITFNPLFVKKPIIASVQWFYAQELSRTYKLPFFLGEHYGLKLYNHFIVLTESMKKLITGRHRMAQCEVIPNGVSESLFDSEIRSGDYILYLGRIDFGDKGVDLLLNSYKLVPEHMRLPLVLAGHGYQWDRLNSMISQLGMERWVKAVGRVDAAEKTRLLSGCRFICFPSRNETFGMVILEACASGKPVILFDRAPMNEVASSACTLVEPFNITAYSEAIVSLIVMSDRELAEKGIDCRNWARNYSWSAIALRQEQFFRKVYEEESRS